MIMYTPSNPNSFYGLPNTLSFQLYIFLKFIIMTPLHPWKHGSLINEHFLKKKDDSLPGTSSFQ